MPTTEYVANLKHDGHVGRAHLYVVSFTGILLHRTHLSVSGSNLSTQYPVMGLPPSSSGSHQVRVTASLVMSEGSRRVGGPGGSIDGIVTEKSHDLHPTPTCKIDKTSFFALLSWQIENLTKLVFGDYWSSLHWLANAVHVLCSNSEDVLFVGC